MAKQVDIYVPTCDNDGKAFDPDERAKMIAHLAERWGGCTVIPGCTGWWHLRASARIQREPVDVWRVIINDWAPLVEQLWWKRYSVYLVRKLKQETILITVSEVEIL